MGGLAQSETLRSPKRTASAVLQPATDGLRVGRVRLPADENTRVSMKNYLLAIEQTRENKLEFA